MQFSETVVAAIIGAAATMSTALFQLFTALRSRSKLEVRPKRGTTLRSIVAVFALMVASAVGGYIYAGLRQQHANDDLRSVRDELNAKLQLLAVTTEKLAQARSEAPAAMPAAMATPPASDHLAESIIYSPACTSAACVEESAQRLALCGAIPAAMQVQKVELFAKVADAATSWEHAVASFDQDLGGAKFVGAPVEHPHDAERKAVCVDFLHWSAAPHLARLVVSFGAQESAQSNVPAAVAGAGGTPALGAAMVQ